MVHGNVVARAGAVVMTLMIATWSSAAVAEAQPGLTATNGPEFKLGASPESSGNRLFGRVVLLSDPNQGIADIRVVGYPDNTFGRRWLGAITDTDGRFTGRPVTEPVILAAYNNDRTLGVVQLVEVGQTDVALPLAPTATIHGSLRDEESEKTAVNRKFKVYMHPTSNERRLNNAFAIEGITDDTGRFKITGLLNGPVYSMFAESADDVQGEVRSLGVARVKPTSGEDVDLGELIIPKPYRPPTFEKYVARNYIKKPPEERLKYGLSRAELGFERLLVIAVEPDSDAAQQFFRLRFDYSYDRKNRNHEKTHKLLYQFITLSLAPSESEEFLAKHEIAFPAKDDATFTVFSSDGSIVGQTTFSELITEGELDPELLAEFLALHRHPPLPNARQLLEAGLAQAVREDKRVLVQVGGPGCGPCYLLSDYLEKHKELMGKDYVHLKLDTRMPEFAEVYEILSEGESRGVPWMLILDSSGTTLITGDTEEGNIGYPNNPVGIDHFERMLVTTKQRLTDDELSTLLLPLQKESKKD